MLFDEVRDSIAKGFLDMQQQLFILKNQLQTKINEIERSQASVLLSGPPSAEAAETFAENVRKIRRSCEAFAAHAGNLSHIKLTLARAAAMVSAEGNLVGLVTLKQCGMVAPPHEMEFFPRVLAEFPRAPVPPRDMQTTHPAFALPLITSRQLFMEESTGPTLEETAPRPDPIAAIMPDLCAPPSQLSRINARNCATCFVFYLPSNIDNDGLRAIFQDCGTVLNAYVAMDKKTGHTRGFGFVDFSTPAEAQRAVAEKDKMPCNGKFLSVTIKIS